MPPTTQQYGHELQRRFNSDCTKSWWQCVNCGLSESMIRRFDGKPCVPPLKKERPCVPAFGSSSQ